MPVCDGCKREFEKETGLSQHRDSCQIDSATRIQAVDLYQSGESYRSVADKLDLPRHQVRKLLQEHDLWRSSGEANAVAWDNGRFDRPEPDLDSSETLSWLIGVLYGDGSVFKAASYDYVVSISVVDKVFRDTFADALESIDLVPSTYTAKKDKRKDQYQARANSKEFWRWWEETSRHTKFGIADEFPAEFVRGVYDSEGSLTRTDQIVCSIANQEEWLLRAVKTYAASEGIQVPGPHEGADEMGYLQIKKPEDIKKFLDWIEPTIPRKRWKN
jgi:hypothetical protein